MYGCLYMLGKKMNGNDIFYQVLTIPQMVRQGQERSGWIELEDSLNARVALGGAAAVQYQMVLNTMGNWHNQILLPYGQARGGELVLANIPLWERNKLIIEFVTERIQQFWPLLEQAHPEIEFANIMNKTRWSLIDPSGGVNPIPKRRRSHRRRR